MRYLTLIIFATLSTLSQAQRLETVVQRGHYEAVKSVAFTPDGKFLLSGSRDKTIKLWELSTGREIRSFLGHESTINDLFITPDGKHFVSSSADFTAKLWNIASGELVRTFSGHTDYMTSVAVSPDGKYLLTAGFDWEAILWNIKTGEEIRRYKVNPDKGIGYGIDAEFSPDGNQIAFGGDNRSVWIYDIDGGEKKFELKPEEGYCGGCGSFIKFNGNDLVSASNSGDVKVWNLTDGSTKKVIYTHDDEFGGLDVQNTNVLVATTDSVKLFERSSGELMWEIGIQSEKENTDISFSPDARLIALSNDDKTIRILNTVDGSLVRVLDGFLNRVDKGGLNYDRSAWDFYIKKYTDLKNDVAISPDGKYLAKGKLGTLTRLWDYKAGKIVNDFAGHEKAVLAMQFSQDGKQLLTGSADHTARLWDVKTGETLVTYKGHRGEIFSVTFSPEGEKIATGSWDGTAKIWDRESGELLTTLTFEQASPYQLRFVNNDIYLLVAGLDKTLKLWEIDSKTEVRNFMGHTDVIHSFDIHPEKPIIASTSWDGKVKIWDMHTGLQFARFADHDGPTYSALFSHSGDILCTTGADRVIRVREGKKSDYSVINEFKGHSAPVTNLSFTPDDKYLVSAAENGEVIIWDMASGKELINYMTLSQRDWMAVNSDGHFNATDGAFKNIVFVKGMKSYSVDQFFDEFYAPTLVKDVFSNRSGNRLNMLDKMQNSPPPQIEILTPKNNQAFDNREVDMLFKVIDAGGGAKQATLFQNGKAILNEKLQVKPGKSQVVAHKFNLVPGLNVIEVSASSKGNIESQKSRVNLQFGGDLKSSLYLLAIGINEYQNESLNLNYASADAEGFVELIKGHTKDLFDKVEVISIYDKEATKDNILIKLDELKEQIRPQDVLYLYYAGHGSMVDNNFYFVPSNNTKLYSDEKLRKTGIYAGELQEKLKAIAALKQVVIIDACQSEGGAEILAQRGATEEKALAQLSRSTGIHVLAAAGSEQFATEFTELGHGLFTYVLLEALSGKADGAPKDGKITIYELKGYLEDQVPELSKKYKGRMQFPHTFSRGQDFPLVVDQ